jgi:hypothetical protein
VQRPPYRPPFFLFFLFLLSLVPFWRQSFFLFLPFAQTSDNRLSGAFVSSILRLPSHKGAGSRLKVWSGVGVRRARQAQKTQTSSLRIDSSQQRQPHAFLSLSIIRPSKADKCSHCVSGCALTTPSSFEGRTGSSQGQLAHLSFSPRLPKDAASRLRAETAFGNAVGRKKSEGTDLQA